MIIMFLKATFRGERLPEKRLLAIFLLVFTAIPAFCNLTYSDVQADNEYDSNNETNWVPFFWSIVLAGLAYPLYVAILGKDKAKEVIVPFFWASFAGGCLVAGGILVVSELAHWGLHPNSFPLLYLGWALFMFIFIAIRDKNKFTSNSSKMPLPVAEAVTMQGMRSNTCAVKSIRLPVESINSVSDSRIPSPSAEPRNSQERRRQNTSIKSIHLPEGVRNSLSFRAILLMVVFFVICGAVIYSSIECTTAKSPDFRANIPPVKQPLAIGVRNEAPRGSDNPPMHPPESVPMKLLTSSAAAEVLYVSACTPEFKAQFRPVGGDAVFAFRRITEKEFQTKFISLPGLVALSAGTYQCGLLVSGYECGFRNNVAVSGGVQNLKFTLKPKPSLFRFQFPDTNVVFAVFDKKGKFIGTSTNDFSFVPFQPCVLNFKAPGWRNKWASITLDKPDSIYNFPVNVERVDTVLSISLISSNGVLPRSGCVVINNGAPVKVTLPGELCALPELIPLNVCMEIKGYAVLNNSQKVVLTDRGKTNITFVVERKSLFARLFSRR